MHTEMCTYVHMHGHNVTHTHMLIYGAPSLVCRSFLPDGTPRCMQNGLSGMQDERGFCAKVTDFGLAIQLLPFQESVKKVRGTEAHLPMQIFQDKQISQASDVHALGLVPWEMYHSLLWPHIWHAEKQRRRYLILLMYFCHCSLFQPHL